MTRLFIAEPLALMGAVLLLAPNVMRRGTLFAVPVSESFRATPEARHAVNAYRLWVIIALAVACLLWLLWPLAWITVLSPLGVFAVGSIAFYQTHKSLAPFAVDIQSAQRSMDVSAAPDRLPRWIWFGLVPFLILTSAAVFLNSHWERLPSIIDLHYAANGVADRWAPKTFKSVYGPLLFGAEFCAWLLGMGLACWYGARRSPYRLLTLATIIVASIWLALLLSTITTLPLTNLPVWAIVTAVFCAPLVVIVFALWLARRPTDQIEKTPERCWKAGMFYYNPDDPALFIQKRLGFGYTFNFANGWSWALLASLLVVIASVPAII
jgi:uncharacterized membrane protein